MNERFTLPRAARMCRAQDFHAAYRRGEKVRVFPLRVAALRRGEGGSRLGMAVGRKVGKAAVRNRWKRAIREAFRLNRHLLQCPCDVVVSVSWDARPEDARRAAGAFLEVIEILNARVAGKGEQ